MASQSDSVDKRCPSCKQPVQSKWKCCPFCETRLECPSRQATTHIQLPESPFSNTDVNEFDPQHIDSIASGSACVENPKQEADSGNLLYSRVLTTSVQDLVTLWSSQMGVNDSKHTDADSGSDDLEITVAEYLRDFEEAVRKGGVTNLSDYINLDLNKWTDVDINIAVLGESGTGKSSFINTIRGLQPGDKDYAKSGCEQTTHKKQQYPHPKNKNLVFWDLPGVGTPQFPKKSYLRVIDVDKYDFFILVMATRFKENDEWLANEICNLEKKFYCVRSKIDFDVYNELMDSDGKRTKADIINTLRENTIKALIKTGVKLPKVFLVNNKNIHEYDFKDLETQLIKDTPDLKRDTLVRSMASLATFILNEKQKILQNREIQVAILASTSSQDCKPGTTVNKAVLFSEIILYKQQFGTDENSLKRIADRMNITFDDFVQKLDIRSTSIVRSVDVFNSFCATFTKEGEIFHRPGTVFFTSIAAITFSCNFQRRMLDMCYNEALRILSVQQKIVIGK